MGVSVKIAELIGQTILRIDGRVGDEAMTLVMTDAKEYRFAHSRDCCEYVRINDICGDLGHLVGAPLLMAEESTNSEDSTEIIMSPDSFTWTFYKFATIKGYVTIRWLGESNGYYSERVQLERTP